MDGGTLGNTEEARLGSTVVDLSVPEQFTIVRDGCALNHVLSVLLDKYKLRQTLGTESSG